MNRYSTILVILLSIISSGCQTTQPVPEYLVNLQVPAFKPTYPEILSEAKQWDPGAKLETVSISLYPEETLQIIFLTFISESEPRFFWGAKIYPDGSLVTDAVDLPFDQTIFRSIDPELIMDAPDAWEIFLSDPVVVRNSETRFRCGRLLLGLFQEPDFPVWRLVIGGERCGPDGGKPTYFHINAITGEKFVYPDD